MFFKHTTFIFLNNSRYKVRPMSTMANAADSAVLTVSLLTLR
jgi:hypothetical protein